MIHNLKHIKSNLTDFDLGKIFLDEIEFRHLFYLYLNQKKNKRKRNSVFKYKKTKWNELNESTNKITFSRTFNVIQIVSLY